MNFYKILNEEENHNGLQYKTGLNVDPLPFRKEGSCCKGGIYFSREDILAFLYFGPWIRKVVLPKGAEVVQDPSKPVKWRASAVKLGRREKITPQLIERLIQEGADVHADDDWALMWASEKGHVEVVKVLLENGADVHADNDYALRGASGNGRVEVVKVLLENGADVHAGNDCALRWASGNGRVEVVKVLKEWMKKEKK